MELVKKYRELSKHYELKATNYLNLIKNIEGGEQLSVILPVIIDNQISEINDINEKHKKIIEDLKYEYEEKINKLEDQIEYYKKKYIEFYITSDEDDYSEEEDDYYEEEDDHDF